jgi:hypothetical protein
MSVKVGHTPDYNPYEAGSGSGGQQGRIFARDALAAIKAKGPRQR